MKAILESFVTQTLICMVLCCMPSGTGIAQPKFTQISHQSNGWIRIEGIVPTNRIVLLKSSSDLVSWNLQALLDGRILNSMTGEILFPSSSFGYWDLNTNQTARYYQFSVSSPTNQWKNQIVFPNDAFGISDQTGQSGQIRWVKFTIRLDQPTVVYYQDGNQYVLHHEFAKEFWSEFKAMHQEDYDKVSLYNNGQKVLLGTVLLPPDDAVLEYGIQFAGRDPLSREMIERYFQVVKSTVITQPGIVVYYMPTFEQGETAAVDESYLASKGIIVNTPNRWISRNQVYAAGWALGRLKYIPGQQIETAYTEGRLLPTDILLTDSVPSEIPFVAGIISTVPATPNSHVAILATSYGVPFVFVADAGLRKRIESFLDSEVILQSTVKTGFGLISVLPGGQTLDTAIRSELLSLKKGEIPSIKPMSPYGAISASTDILSLSNVQHFGGKASQYGILRRAIPNNCPPAVAFSFDLWGDFMNQTMPTGKTLSDEIRKRLSPFTYPPDIAIVRTNLKEIRSLITKTAEFSATQKQAIIQALSSFNSNKNIRFRSSSNAEDDKSFSAAGLYDSYSGCLADDLDGDNMGPSKADPSEPDERGVFRAIQKVYASFYNDNAFLERLRHSIDESKVGMAILAHYSYPDEIELANGVGTVMSEKSLWGSPSLTARLVTQPGAVSVANPEGNARPEIVNMGEGGMPQLEQASTLIPLGSRVFSEDEYSVLSSLLFAVYKKYPNSTSSSIALDFEYKKIAPSQFILKQVRQIPTAATNIINRYLLSETVRHWVFQSESTDIYANHRLRCWLTAKTRNIRLDNAGYASCFYDDINIEFREGTNVITLKGSPSLWPDASHSFSKDARRGMVVVDRWSRGTGTNKYIYQLTSVIPDSLSVATPFVPQAEIRKWLQVTYPRPVYNYNSSQPITSEEVQLVSCPEIEQLKQDTVKVFSGPNGLRFSVAFLNPPADVPVLGVDNNFWGTLPAFYSPLAHTIIYGLTTNPIELTDYFSQSSKAGHKYRYDWYIFEPVADPNLSETLRQELVSKNIQWISVDREAWTGGKVNVQIKGFDGKFRSLP